MLLLAIFLPLDYIFLMHYWPGCSIHLKRVLIDSGRCENCDICCEPKDDATSWAALSVPFIFHNNVQWTVQLLLTPVTSSISAQFVARIHVASAVWIMNSDVLQLRQHPPSSIGLRDDIAVQNPSWLRYPQQYPPASSNCVHSITSHSS